MGDSPSESGAAKVTRAEVRPVLCAAAIVGGSGRTGEVVKVGDGADGYEVPALLDAVSVKV